MINVFRVRLLFDFVAIGLMIACLAYWWLDNLSHEVIGTALFALVIGHNVFNRRWYGNVRKGRCDVIRAFNILTIFCLAIAMLIMLATSLLISRDLFSFMALDGAFAVREIHMFAGYWTLLIIAIHLGTRWLVMMSTIRSIFGFSSPSASRTMALRAMAMATATWGVRSSTEMAFGSKLTLTYSLDMWDFNESAVGFFVNYASIVGLYAALVHYGLGLLGTVRARRRCDQRGTERYDR